MSEHTAPVARSRLSAFTAFLSAACAVHCMVVPVATAMAPMAFEAGVHGLDDWLLPLVAGFALLSAGLGYVQHRTLRSLLLPGAGLAAFLLGHWLEGQVGVAYAGLAGAAALSGSMLLASRHVHAHPHPHAA